LLNSLRGHYLAIAGILALIILSAALAAQIYLSRTENQSHRNIEVRNEVIELSRQIRNTIWQAENVQKTFILSPLQKYQHAFNSYLEFALHDTSVLEKTFWIHSAGLKTNIKKLHTNIRT